MEGSGSHMSLLLHLATLSDTGLVRERNEDAVQCDPPRGILVVADGMGGHPAGDVASRLAAETASRTLLTWDPAAVFLEPTDPDAPEGSRSPLGDRMAEAVTEANERILDDARRHPDRAGMGTTLTALLADRTTGRWAIGHVGDSRAYRFAEGSLHQITRDDSWVQEQVEAGVMTPERAREHPYANVLSRALGLDRQVEPTVYEGPLTPGEVFLLCTDGLSGMIEDERIREVLAESTGVDEAAAALVQAAREQGGRDNITVGLLAVTSD